MFEATGGSATPLEPAHRPLNPALSNGHTLSTPVDNISDDSRSSSLSDIEDGLENEDVQNVLDTGHGPADGDSEAETERIDETPQKILKHNNVTLGAIPFEKSPSKLAQSTTINHDLDIERFSDSAISSPEPSDAGLQSDGAPDREVGAEEDEDHEPELAVGTIGKKRKRSRSEIETASNSEDEDQPRRKRTASVKSEVNQDPVASDDEDPSDIDNSRDVSAEPIDGAEDHEEDMDSAAEDENQAQAIQQPLIKAVKGKRGKRTKQTSRRTRKDLAEDGHRVEIDAEDRIEDREDSEDDEAPEGDEGEDAEAAARSEEELAKKMAAMDSLAALERNFAALRDRLYDERIVSLNKELAQLAGPNPSHPGFLRQAQCVRKHRDDKFEFEQRLLVYKIGALKRKSLAERSQILSSYFQTTRDIRERHLEKASEFFYRIQRDRIKTDENTPSYAIPFPTRRSQQIMQQTAYNKEVSILSGVAKFVGFPAAPEVANARQQELDEDLEKMGIPPNPVRQPRAPQASIIRQTSPAVSRQHAEEQFLEQNPWANPPYIHRMQRQLSGHPKTNNVLVTPAAQKHAVDVSVPAGSASTIAENPSGQASSTLNTPYTADPDSLQAQNQSYQASTSDAETRRMTKSERTHDRHARAALTSPSELRKDGLTGSYHLQNSKLESQIVASEQITGLRVPSPSASRLALFSSPSRPGTHDMTSRHQNSSPMALHQHARETSITAGSGFGSFGVR